MALPKLFQRIFWHNNTTPAINEDNLNAMSKAINDIDDRVIAREANIMEAVANANTYAQNAARSAEAAEEAARSAQGGAQYAERAEAAAEAAEGYAEEAEALTQATVFSVNFLTGNLEYTNEDIFDFAINTGTGNLEWEVTT